MAEPKTRKSSGREFAETLIIALILAFLIRTFVFESFQVQGNSMKPTLHNDNRVLVNKLAFKFSKPKTGEIVVFQSPVDPKQDWIKRVIGTPGETVSIKNSVVYIDGKKYPEPFLKYRHVSKNYGPLKVPPGHLFVLGDNRPISYDSRYFGMLSEKRLKGQAFVVWWPVSAMRWLP